MKMYELGTERAVHGNKAAAKLFMPYVSAYNRAVAKKSAKLNAVDGINRSGELPVLIIHGKHDNYVDFDRVSIYSCRDSITDPNAEYLVLNGRYADHQCFFKTDAANDLTKVFYEKRGELEKKYGGLGNIPGEELDAFFAGFDMDSLNEPNSGLLEYIEAFYLKAKAAHGGEPSANE